MQKRYGDKEDKGVEDCGAPGCGEDTTLAIGNVATLLLGTLLLILSQISIFERIGMKSYDVYCLAFDIDLNVTCAMNDNDVITIAIYSLNYPYRIF